MQPHILYAQERTEGGRTVKTSRKILKQSHREKSNKNREEGGER